MGWSSKYTLPGTNSSIANAPENKALLRDYQPLVSLNKASLGPAISWGKRGLGGVPLGSHEFTCQLFMSIRPIPDL